MRHVSVTPAKDASASTSAYSIRFLAWLQPNQTPIGQALTTLEGEVLKVSNDPQFGEVVSVSTIGGNRKIKATLSKEFAWRPIFIAIDTLDGAPLKRDSFSYRWENQELFLDRCSSMVYRVPMQKPFRVEEFSVHEVSFSCSRTDLELEIPPGSFVEDSLRGVSYIKKYDGTTRNIVNGEMEITSAWKDLMETEAGELLPEARGLSARFVLSLFSLFCVAGFLLVRKFWAR